MTTLPANSESPLLDRDDRLVSGRTGVRWRPAWAWSRDTELHLREVLRDAPKPVVHVGCGSSRIGDVRLDLFHPGADLRGDARDLPFTKGSVGTVLQDPPWTVEALPEREKWVQEALRVLRIGGLYVVHAPWMPARPTLGLEAAWVRNDASFNGFPRAPVVISVWRKRSNGTRRTAV